MASESRTAENTVEMPLRMRTAPPPVSLAPAPQSVASEPRIAVHNLSMSYGGPLAIEDISLDIHPNRVTAFIGPSGCGKSTLLRCLNRLNDLIDGASVTGKITLDG